MQTVRNHIVEILKENGTATVAELAEKLGMAQVSVRHHLDILVGEDLVESAGVRRRNGAGRPSQIYSLTQQASKLFPQRHQVLANEMLSAMKSLLPAEEIEGVLLRLADKTVQDAPLARPDQAVEDRLEPGRGVSERQGLHGSLGSDRRLLSAFHLQLPVFRCFGTEP